jgi:hypothetical protein
MRPQSDKKHLNGTAVNSTGFMQHTATADGDTKKKQMRLRGTQSGEMKGRVKT